MQAPALRSTPIHDIHPKLQDLRHDGGVEHDVERATEARNLRLEQGFRFRGKGQPLRSCGEEDPGGSLVDEGHVDEHQPVQLHVPVVEEGRVLPFEDPGDDFLVVRLEGVVGVEGVVEVLD